MILSALSLNQAAPGMVLSGSVACSLRKSWSSHHVVTGLIGARSASSMTISPHSILGLIHSLYLHMKLFQSFLLRPSLLPPSSVNRPKQFCVPVRPQNVSLGSVVIPKRYQLEGMVSDEDMRKYLSSQDRLQAEVTSFDSFSFLLFYFSIPLEIRFPLSFSIFPFNEQTGRNQKTH